MDNDDSRVVLVTGAAGNLGAHAVRGISDRGVRVAAVDLHSASPEESAAQGQRGEVFSLDADLTSEAAVREVVESILDRFGRVDAIVNTAGIQGATGSFHEYDEAELWRVMQVNFFSVWIAMQVVIPLFIKDGGGAIVNVASSLGYRGWPEVPAYVASKHAVVGLTKSVALEYADRGIRANCLCPSGMAGTRLFLDVAASVGNGDEAAGEAEILTKVPRGKMSGPDEVAEVAVWLALDAPEALSGVVLPVDGAETAW
ncbi:MAG: SDR family oxidoreductase [Actinomycetota bacterium]